jgi:hypothetical protein
MSNLVNKEPEGYLFQPIFTDQEIKEIEEAEEENQDVS